MLQSSPRYDRASLGEFFDDSLIGVALFAFFCKDTLIFKAWGFFCIKSIFIDSIGNFSLYTALDQFSLRGHPDIKILAPMTWRGMHKSRASIVSDMIAIK